MTLPQQIITIALCALGTQLTRFLPFLIFNEHKKLEKSNDFLIFFIDL
mgnify:CR=1 FL=1